MCLCGNMFYPPNSGTRVLDFFRYWKRVNGVDEVAVDEDDDNVGDHLLGGAWAGHNRITLGRRQLHLTQPLLNTTPNSADVYIANPIHEYKVFFTVTPAQTQDQSLVWLLYIVIYLNRN